MQKARLLWQEPGLPQGVQTIPISARSDLTREKSMPANPCDRCATWRCAACGWKRLRANKHFARPLCSKCLKTEGDFLPVRHRPGTLCPLKGEG